MTTVLTLGEMVNLALGTPEVGCVNYNALHTLLHGILSKLQISDAPVQLGQMIARRLEATDGQLTPLGSEEWGEWIGSQPSLADNKDDGGKRGGMEKENVGGGKQGGRVEADKGAGGKDKGAGGGKDKGTGGGADKGAAGKGSPGEKGKKEGGKAAGGEASRGRKSSGGKGGVGSPSSADSVPLMMNSLPFHELAKKVEKLEESWKELNELQKIDPFGADEKGAPLHDMWETLQFQKRLDANTEGVDRLMALVQEILHRIQKLAENDAEQMALINGSHQRIDSLAPKTDFDAVKQELNSIAGKVGNLQEKDGLVTWDNLESALKGTDELQGKDQGRRGGEKESTESMERGGDGGGGGSLMDGDESELALIGKEEEEDGGGGAGRRDGATGRKDGGKGVRSEQESGKGGKAEGGKRDGVWVTESGRQLEGNLDDGAGSRRSSGGGKAGPSEDLQTVLGALGKLDDKFQILMAKVSTMEGMLPKDTFNLSADTMKRMSDSALVIETTREQMRDFSDELSRSYLDPLKHANEIIAMLKDTADCPQLLQPPTPTDEATKLSGRRSTALGALEKSMKLVDKTFGVLQRAVQNLDCKLTNQTIKWEEKLSSFPDGGSRPGSGSRHLISSPSMEDEVCKDEEPEVANLDSQTRMKELEKKLGLRKDEMCKMTKRLNQLNKAISQQLHEAKGRLNDLESRVSVMNCDLKRLIQKIESEQGGEYVVPTAAVLDGSGVSLLIGVQKALDELKTDMEKLSGKTESLQENNTRHQDSIENLLKLASDMEDKKTDKADFMEKATKQDLDLKLDSKVFESTCDEMTKNVNALLGRVSQLDEECMNSFDKLTSDLGGYMTSEEFDRIRNCMAKQFKVLAKKLAKMQKQLEIAKLVGDDAAGIRRQLFKCLSCDRTILMASQDPKPSLPARDGLFPYRSTKPYTTYELEQIRQHARCFQIPKGLSNYERAVIERQLSRFKLRDLRGNANPYWKQDHSSSTVKHIRTAAVSPNSQGDAAVSPTVTDDSSSFPDPYACTRPCGGSHTLTSPYKRVIHMADLNSLIMTDEQNTNQQNHENTPPSSCPPVLIDRSPVVNEKGPVISGEEVEEERATVPAHLDKGHLDLRPNSGTDSLEESHSDPQPPQTTSAVAAHSSVVKDLSDDSGRRFSDPTINGSSAGKKADLKKASGVKPSSVGDRRISAPNTSSSVGSTPQSSTTHQKKRRFSTPVTMSTKDASSPVAHFKKVLKENEMKEEDDNKEAEEEESTKNNNRDNSEQQ